MIIFIKWVSYNMKEVFLGILKKTNIAAHSN